MGLIFTNMIKTVAVQTTASAVIVPDCGSRHRARQTKKIGKAAMRTMKGAGVVELKTEYAA
jgi:hypothetical protein